MLLSYVMWCFRYAMLGVVVVKSCFELLFSVVACILICLLVASIVVACC